MTKKPKEAVKADVKKVAKSAKNVKSRKEKKPTDKLADKTALTKFLQGIFGDAQKKVLRRLWKKAQEINKLEPKYEAMSDEELAEQTEEFKRKIDKALKVARAEQGINKTGKKRPPVSDVKILNELLPDAFAVAREASKRVAGLRPYDVQLIGGMVLHEGAVAEMKTGEGKTLVAMLPAYLNGLTGRGVHVVTVNDYLAQRDAGWNGPIYDFLGMSVGVIINNASFVYDAEYENEDHEDERFRHLKPATRKEAYAADGAFPLIILRLCVPEFMIFSGYVFQKRFVSPPLNKGAFIKNENLITKTAATKPMADEKRRSVTLTDKGIEKVQEILGVENLYSTKNTRLVYHLEQAIRAEILFKRDKDYVVTNSGEVIIVDEHTGRLMQGRRYNEGLHQAIEAKEGVVVKQESMTLATISFQNFFRLYTKLSGMTGTAFTEAEEFQQIYALDVIQIPPNKPIARVDKDDLIYKTKAAKLKAIAEEIKKYHEKGQPVLVGSGSIANNEEIARYLKQFDLPYEILNAKNNEREAAIIAKAGEKGAITLATNMAGRGTDIKLGEGVKELGGLVVIGSERHDSRRVDNQLRGRGGRQGDPGTTQFFVSCEDDLMRIFQGDRVKMLMTRLGVDDDMPIQTKAISRTLEAAQKRIEGFNFDSRKNVVQYDNVINRHRKVVYMMRRKILEGGNIFPEIKRLMRDETKMLTEFSSRVNKKFDEEFKAVFDFDDDLIHGIGLIRKEKEREKLALEAVEEAYHKKELEFGEETMRKVEREVYLKVLDTLWMQHLENMQHLREGIHWRSVGQRDPLVEYRSESQKLFDGLQRNLREEVLKILLSITPAEAAADNVTDGEEYESELTKMAESQTEKGVNEISAGEKNLDDEFKKKSPKTTAKRATVKKSGAKKKSSKKKKSKSKRK